MILCCLWTLLISCQSDTTEDSAVPFEPQDTAPPSAFEVTGTVIDDNGSPVSEAMVLVGGRDETMVLTDEQGYFSLWYTDIGLGEPAIVASKAGYRAQGFEFFKPDTPITIKMREVKAPDNPEYTFEDPGDGFNEMEQNCSHCHTDFVADFLDSKHAGAASNPLLHDLYAGITRIYNNESDCVEAGGRWAMGLEPGTEDNAIEKCYLGGGVLPDLNPECGQEDAPACDDPDIGEEQAPTAFGACADCHASGINGELGDRNLHDAVGLAYELGVHCDTCHKVKDVDLSQPPGYGKRLVVHRPGEPGRNTFEWDPVYYGPLADVPNVAMGGSPQLKFNESVFCAGCHEQKQEALLPDETLDAEKWPEGLPIHSTYTEWKEGPYNQDATQCQWCHMPADTEKNNSVDISTPYNQSITFGFPREPEDIRQHIFRGPLHGEPRLIDTALHLSLDVKQEANTLA
ncbi:MAG: carboxypeptidase-like regulatory domain-containing protein, partial [Myxococcota bacterium]|nr:carboxypeptidase-like regulatory domain-containing protein [Myxococcota bacterium]